MQPSELSPTGLVVLSTLGGDRHTCRTDSAKPSEEEESEVLIPSWTFPRMQRFQSRISLRTSYNSEPIAFLGPSELGLWSKGGPAGPVHGPHLQGPGLLQGVLPAQEEGKPGYASSTALLWPPLTSQDP